MPFIVPRPSQCPDCKGGTVGMAMCLTCAGSGTIFKVNDTIFPDTREGYDAAEKELNKIDAPFEVGRAEFVGGRLYWRPDGGEPIELIGV